MTEADLFETIDPVLAGLGCSRDEGETFHEPLLDVVRYDIRRARLHPIPLLGRALGVVATVVEPADLSLVAGGYGTLLRRVAGAINGRYPPWPFGATVGLTTLVLATSPIGPGDDAALQAALTTIPRMRSVPLGLIRVDLDGEGLAFALASGPPGVFPEAEALADALTPHLRRFVTPLPI